MWIKNYCPAFSALSAIFDGPSRKKLIPESEISFKSWLCGLWIIFFPFFLNVKVARKKKKFLQMVYNVRTINIVQGSWEAQAVRKLTCFSHLRIDFLRALYFSESTLFKQLLKLISRMWHQFFKNGQKCAGC